MAGQAFVVLIVPARCTSATTIREFWEKEGLLLRNSGRHMACLAPQSEVMVEECGSGTLPLLGPRVRYRGFHGFTLYWQISNIRAGIRAPKWGHSSDKLSRAF